MKDDKSLEKDNFMSSIQGASFIFFMYDLMEKETFTFISETIFPWLIEAKNKIK